MKILIFNWQDITNPLAGGAEVHLHEVFERIADQGNDVTLFCHRYKGSSPEETRNGIKIIRRGGRFFFNFHVPIAYFRMFRRQKFDVIIDDVNKIPFFTPLFVSDPVQGVTHHLFGKSIFLETAFPLALYVYLTERLIKPVYRHVHFIIGSPSTHKEYLEWGFPPEQVSIVNYCVNKKTYYPASIDKHESRRICYFGRLKKYKSVEHLLQAFRDLDKEFEGLKLDIIGDGDDRERLENVAKSLGIDGKVTFHGFIPENDKAPLLQKMRFVVNTSSKEGWGLTVVEANACGIPVIAADVPGLRDSVIDGKTGLLYPFGDIEALKGKMRSVLLDDTIRSELSKAALEWGSSFDWNTAADATMQYIRQTVTIFKDKKFRT